MGKFRTYSVKKKSGWSLILKVGYKTPFTLTGHDQYVVHQYSHSSLCQLSNLEKKSTQSTNNNFIWQVLYEGPYMSGQDFAYAYSFSADETLFPLSPHWFWDRLC